MGYLLEWPSGGLKASRMLHGATGCPSVPAALTSISRLYLLLASSRLRNHALPPGSPHPYVRWTTLERRDGQKVLPGEVLTNESGIWQLPARIFRRERVFSVHT